MQQHKHFTGLTDEQVIESRKKYGQNILTPPAKEPLWKLFLEKLSDPIIKILLVALLASFGIAFYELYHGEPLSVFLEPAGIFIAVTLATVIGFYFEVSANKKFEILNQINDDTAIKVIRNGNVTEVPKKDVVVGDIVILNTGEEIPADGILQEAISLQINESTLTGEPIIKKSTDEREFKKDATYPTNHVYKGTTVVEGNGIMEVIAVGDSTEYGKVYVASQIDNSVKTPLNLQLNRLGHLITIASYVIASVIVAARLILYFGEITYPIDWIDAAGYILHTIMIAVTLIVVSVPEGLPMSVTLSLALSMRRMLKANNLVRKMHACETMGAATVICTDKTGTLTQNQMRIYASNFFALQDQKLSDNTVSNLIKESIAVNSTAFLDHSDPQKIKTLGNPTEAALLLWLHSQHTDYLKIREAATIIEQLPFTTERKYMATVIHSPALQKSILYVKGAPEVVLSLSKSIQKEQETTIPVEQERSTIEQQLLTYQGQAMRTLGFAYRIIDKDTQVFKEQKLILTDLTYLGIVAIADPVRSDVPEAIKSCMDAGISVKIVTGDTPGTAKEIGRQIGLWTENDTDRNHITGIEFAEMSDEKLLERILDLKIMSRARPMDKERLVRLLQSKNQVVAVTGDGTNDAPALNAAQIGLSMGDGTTVAKEASAITILDNSFHSITQAVMWGRSLYQNIQRFLVFQMTINVAACLIVMIGSFLGTTSPLTVTQMLWVNIIMDTFAALALASLPPNQSVMKRKPRKTSDHIITKKMAWQIVGMGLFFVVILFGLLQYFKQAEITSLTQFRFTDFCRSYFDFSEGNLSPYELSLFFTIFVILQFWNMFNAKAFDSGKSALADLRQCLTGFVWVAAVIFVGQVLITTFGNGMFNVVPLSVSDWIILTLVTSLVLWIGELTRYFRYRNI